MAVRSCLEEVDRVFDGCDHFRAVLAIAAEVGIGQQETGQDSDGEGADCERLKDLDKSGAN